MTAGHRCVPHAADVILEAWADTRAACLQEVVLAVVESFVDLAGVTATDEVPLHVDGASDEEVLIALLEEVLFVVDAQGALPVGLRLDEDTGGGLTGTLATVPTDEVEVTGAVPKGVSRSGLVFDSRDGSWRCRVLVDV